MPGPPNGPGRERSDGGTRVVCRVGGVKDGPTSGVIESELSPHSAESSPAIMRQLESEAWGLDIGQVGTYCLGTSLTVGDPSA